MTRWWSAFTFSSVAAVMLALAAGQPLQAPLSAGGPAASCESLANLALPNAKITMAQPVAEGAFKPPTAGTEIPAEEVRLYAKLPAFCRVAATLTPSSDSDIKSEVWLPRANWNGKFQAVGNGGWAGSIPYPAMAAALVSGYATASSDMGHQGNNADFALGHPEKLVDFDHRSTHEMTEKAKAIIAANYGQAARYSYFNGCSQGGRQGLEEAQRYPNDFDGIVAGDPVLYGMRLHAGRLALNMMVNRPGRVIPASKYPMIHQAALNACDALDGVKDGVIENPTRCKFDPKSIQCRGEEGPSCLTEGQIESARAMVSPVRHPKTGAIFFEPHLWPGSELMWGALGGPEPMGNIVTALKNVAFKNRLYDWRRFDPATDLDRSVQASNGAVETLNPNIKAFASRGKLLMYHGWNDQQISPQISTIYYNNVLKTIGQAQVDSSLALFMVPGMNHCRGGAGTDAFDKMAAIEQWVEQGKKPAQIVAAHVTNGKVDRTRPLCPFGQVAKWKGSGSTDAAANFACVAETMDFTARW